MVSASAAVRSRSAAFGAAAVRSGVAVPIPDIIRRPSLLIARAFPPSLK